MDLISVLEKFEITEIESLRFSSKIQLTPEYMTPDLVADIVFNSFLYKPNTSLCVNPFGGTYTTFQKSSDPTLYARIALSEGYASLITSRIPFSQWGRLHLSKNGKFIEESCSYLRLLSYYLEQN